MKRFTVVTLLILSTILMNMFIPVKTNLVLAQTHETVSDDAKSNNRYYYKNEYGSKTKVSTISISQEQVYDKSEIEWAVTSLIGVAASYLNPALGAAVIVTEAANQFYGMNRAGTITTYKTQVKRYKIHRGTGKKILVSTYYKVDVVAKYLNGVTYKTYSYNSKSR